MPTLNINGNIRTNTVAGWGADATVYTAKTILVSTDATYGATDQRKFKIADGTQTWSNLDYFPVSGYDDASSSIQTQLNAKLTSANIVETITNGVTTNAPSENAVFDALALKKTIATGNAYKFETTDASGNLQETTVTASRAVATDANGLPTASATTATELGYLSGVTSAIQTQLDSKVSDTTFFQTSNQSIADSTSYYIAAVTSPATSLALSSMIPVKGGTLIGVSLGGFNASTVGSNEAWTVKLWYNDGLNSVTLTTNFTGGNANRNYFLDVDGLSTAINDGNCAVEFAAPALATNPTGFRPTATIYIKR